MSETRDPRILDEEPLVDEDAGRVLSDDEILTEGAGANQSAPGLPDADEIDQTESDRATDRVNDPPEPGWVPDEAREDHAS